MFTEDDAGMRSGSPLHVGSLGGHWIQASFARISSDWVAAAASAFSRPTVLLVVPSTRTTSTSVMPRNVRTVRTYGSVKSNCFAGPLEYTPPLASTTMARLPFSKPSGPWEEYENVRPARAT